MTDETSLLASAMDAGISSSWAHEVLAKHGPAALAALVTQVQVSPQLNIAVASALEVTATEGESNVNG